MTDSQEGRLGRKERARRLGQRGCVLWLTGLSGAGKSTLAAALDQSLNAAGRATYLLDGDVLRRGLCADLGFGDEDRRENVRRVGEVAALFADAGLITICALISPFRSERAAARRAAGDCPFVEIFVDAPLSACEARDPKGLYARARRGEIPDFTGIDSAYEPPEAPELRIDTERLSIAESLRSIERRLDEMGILPPC